MHDVTLWLSSCHLKPWLWHSLVTVSVVLQPEVTIFGRNGGTVEWHLKPDWVKQECLRPCLLMRLISTVTLPNWSKLNLANYILDFGKNIHLVFYGMLWSVINNRHGCFLIYSKTRDLFLKCLIFCFMWLTWSGFTSLRYLVLLICFIDGSFSVLQHLRCFFQMHLLLVKYLPFYFFSVVPQYTLQSHIL